MSADPRNAPTQGVQPTEKVAPKTMAEKNPAPLALAARVPPRKMLPLITPR